MFTKFPASSALGEHDLAARIAAYCETVENCYADDVESACNRLGKIDSAFIPSAGQVYAAAQEFASRRAEENRNNILRLATSRSVDKPEYSQEHRERMKAQFQDLVAELKSGVNFNPEFGKLQPGEKPRAHNANNQSKTTPPSWLERWERENGRPYFPVYPKQAAE